MATAAPTLAELAAQRIIIDRLIGEHRGRLFGSAGDSLIAEFQSPVEAVRTAVDVQLALHARTQERESGPPGSADDGDGVGRTVDPARFKASRPPFTICSPQYWRTSACGLPRDMPLTVRGLIRC